MDNYDDETGRTALVCSKCGSYQFFVHRLSDFAFSIYCGDCEKDKAFFTAIGDINHGDLSEERVIN